MPYKKIVKRCRVPSLYYTWWGEEIAPGTLWTCRHCGITYRLTLFETAGVRKWVAQD
jgi:hypothetical protein